MDVLHGMAWGPLLSYTVYRWLVFDKVLFCGPEEPGTHYAAQSDLKLTAIPLPHRFNAEHVAGGRNVPIAVQAVAKASIDQSREMKYQSLNEYRKRFSLKPYTSFEELTGEKEMAAELKALYSDIDVMELYPALLVEKPRPDAIFGETMVELGAPFSLKGLMGNPICSPQYWKPSTFGGEVGFKIINTASIQSLICNNVKGCPFTSFNVQDPQPTKTATINASASHSRLDDINPTVLIKRRSTEL